MPVETSDENDMEIDVYDLKQSTLASYDFFCQESYEICKGMLASSPTASPSALEGLFLLQQINSDYFQDIGELDYYISNISLRSVQDF